MSEQSTTPSTTPVDAGRQVVASFRDYTGAERAVDRLADSKFPVERVSIVGEGLKLVEQVTGRLTLAKAALRGLLIGAVTGGLIGWLFAVFDWFDPTVARGWLIVDGLWFGAFVGLLMGLLTHALTGGRRDFDSVAGMRAERYDVLVDAAVAAEARRLLRDPAGEPAAPAASTSSRSDS